MQTCRVSKLRLFLVDIISALGPCSPSLQGCLKLSVVGMTRLASGGWSLGRCWYIAVLPAVGMIRTVVSIAKNGSLFNLTQIVHQSDIKARYDFQNITVCCNCHGVLSESMLWIVWWIASCQSLFVFFLTEFRYKDQNWIDTAFCIPGPPSPQVIELLMVPL